MSNHQFPTLGADGYQSPYTDIDYSKGPKVIYGDTDVLRIVLNDPQTDDDDEWGRTEQIALRQLTDEATTVRKALFGYSSVTGLSDEWDYFQSNLFSIDYSTAADSVLSIGTTSLQEGQLQLATGSVYSTTSLTLNSGYTTIRKEGTLGTKIISGDNSGGAGDSVIYLYSEAVDSAAAITLTVNGNNYVFSTSSFTIPSGIDFSLTGLFSFVNSQGDSLGLTTSLVIGSTPNTNTITNDSITIYSVATLDDSGLYFTPKAGVAPIAFQTYIKPTTLIQAEMQFQRLNTAEDKIYFSADTLEFKSTAGNTILTVSEFGGSQYIGTSTDYFQINTTTTPINYFKFDGITDASNIKWGYSGSDVITLKTQLTQASMDYLGLNSLTILPNSGSSILSDKLGISYDIENMVLYYANEVAIGSFALYMQNEFGELDVTDATKPKGFIYTTASGNTAPNTGFIVEDISFWAWNETTNATRINGNTISFLTTTGATSASKIYFGASSWTSPTSDVYIEGGDPLGSGFIDFRADNLFFKNASGTTIMSVNAISNKVGADLIRSLSSNGVLTNYIDVFNSNNMTIRADAGTLTLISTAGSVAVSSSSTLSLSGTSSLALTSSTILIPIAPPTSAPATTGQLYTQTATQLGGSGTTKVLCIK